jgi:molecular chaperone DnaK (HSP70)
LQQDYIVSEEIDEIDSLQTEAEENKEKILFTEKNTIKVNEIFEDVDKKLTKNELEELLSEEVDLVGEEFKKRTQEANMA